MSNSLSYLVELLLSQHKIPFDKEELSFQIQSHPSYPSLHSITGVLGHFDIDNLALDVPVNQDTLSQLPDSFLAQIDSENEKTFVIVNKKSDTYQLFHGDKKKENISSSEFLEQFTGIIVAVEKTEDTEVIKKNTSKINTVLLLSASILFIALFVITGFSAISITYLLLSAIGIYISTSIIKQEQGETSFLGDTFCSSDTSSKKSCDSVLSSKGAQIGSYKLSDFSLVYFASILVSTWLLALINSSLNAIFIISLIAIPITLYSIYYQYAIVKQWCLLCLSIVGVLWLQATLILSTNYSTLGFSSITGIELVVVGFTFLSVFAIWNVLKPNIKLIKELKESKIKYFKFKRDYSLFEALLNKSQPLNTSIENTSEIIFGNRNAPLNITLVTSPFCGHCKPVHNSIEKILKKYPEEVQVCIRFSANEANTPLINITSRLLELYHTEGELKCLEAMHDIYNDMNEEAWVNKWSQTNNKTHYLNTLKSQIDWCTNNAINFTPAILINGKSFPKEYERSELIYFIEDLHEAAGNVTIDPSVLEKTV